MSNSFSSLTSPRLLLRRLKPGDLAALCSYRELPEVARFQSWTSFGPEHATNLIASQVNLEPGVPGTWFQFAIIDRATNRMIGDCGLHCLENQPRLMEIGITLAPAAQHQGFATEGLSSVLDFAFQTLDAHRICAVTDAQNIAAAALFHRLGFRKEAHFIDHRWYKGGWDSEFVFALLHREWTLKGPRTCP